MVKAISAGSVFHSVGVNHHIDFSSEPALALATAAVNYLGVKHLRDCPDNVSCVGPTGTWQLFANATGVQFCAYLTEGSLAAMQRDLGLIKQLAAQGIIEYLEGGNEEDDAYPKAQGNTIAITLAFQKSDVWPTGQALKIPVIMMSFGAGWTAANKYHGDYDKIGDASAWCDYGNAHTYPNPGQRTGQAIQQLNADARLATPSKPIITTEIGWSHATAGVERLAMFAVLDGILYGNPMIYFYALFDDSSGAWGLFDKDGTPRPAAMALRNLLRVFSDTGTVARSDSLDYTLTGAANDNNFLAQRSDGMFLLVLWNEIDATHPVNIKLTVAPQTVALWDPMRAALMPMVGGASFSITLPNYPVVLELNMTAVTVINRPGSLSGNVGRAVGLSGISILDQAASASPGNLAMQVDTTVGRLHDGSISFRMKGTLASLNLQLKAESIIATAPGKGQVKISVWTQKGVLTSTSVPITIM